MEKTRELRVSESRDYLVCGGKPFFYLADTVWMAFANLPLEKWSGYLSYRRLQGFNALQISILPVTHDTSVSDENIDPCYDACSQSGRAVRYRNASVQCGCPCPVFQEVERSAGRIQRC